MPKEAEGKTGRPTERRNKPQRPRDELGRPQPWGTENRLELEDFDASSRDENHRSGIALFNAGRYFAAHEAWETAWKQSRDTEDAEFFKGLSQLGAGYVHLLRGNRHGAVTLLERARSRICGFPRGHFEVDTLDVARRCETDIASIGDGRLVPGPEALVGDMPSLASYRPV